MAKNTYTAADVLPFADRFWQHVNRAGDCWEWTSGRTRGGYGNFNLPHGAKRRANRMAWELTYGAIPDGLFVCHRCDNPPCVRPDHLFLGTCADNNRDAKQKGRVRTGQRNGAHTHPEKLRRGEAHHTTTLTEAEVREIRLRRVQGETYRHLAKVFAVTPMTIWHIVHGQTWRHVT